MADTPTSSPEHVGAHGDPGDETANRYRFQWTWAAVVCCALVDDTQDVEEVFCEHHEDVLLKHRDGSFTGHQVKTRSNDQPPWKAKDEAVVAACVRFVRLDSSYPDKFRGFCFLTNHPFHSAENGQDISFVLRSIKEAASVSALSSTVAGWVRQVARAAGVTDAAALAALSKAVAKADLPKLRDSVMRLIDTLVQCWPPATDCSHDAVKRAAQALIDECGRASSLAHVQTLPGYLIAIQDDDAKVKACITGKRMTRDRVESILEHGGDSTATLTGDV